MLQHLIKLLRGYRLAMVMVIVAMMHAGNGDGSDADVKVARVVKRARAMAAMAVINAERGGC